MEEEEVERIVAAILKEWEYIIRLIYEGKQTEANEKMAEILDRICVSELNQFAKKTVEAFQKEEKY